MSPGCGAWLLAICVSRVGAYMIYIACAAALPVLQREWDMSATAAGGIASCFQIAYAIALMGCSEIADRVGAQRVFLAILDWYGGRSAQAWGWAFVSLGVAGLVAVASVLTLQRAPGADVLQRARARS